MRPSELVNKWANHYASDVDMPIDESLVAARVVALLDAVEGANWDDMKTAIVVLSDLPFQAHSLAILRAALALRGER